MIDLPSKSEILSEELGRILSAELGSIASEAGLDPGRLREEALADPDLGSQRARGAWRTLEGARADATRAREFDSAAASLARELLKRPVTLSVGLGLLVAAVAAVALQLISLKPVFLSAGLALLPAVLFRVIAKRGDSTDVGVAEERQWAAEEKYRQTLREAAIAPWIRAQIDRAEARNYHTELSFRDASGLAEVDDPSHEIPTAAKQRLEALIGRMPGGAIGICGLRGVGKSTLMRSICAASTTGEKEVLGVVVDAPVHYEAREFVLHLFARVCAELLGAEEVERLRGWQSPGPALLRKRRGLPRSHPLLALALLGVGAALALPELLHVSFAKHGALYLGAVCFGLGYVMFALSMSSDPRFRRVLFGSRRERDAKPDDRATAALRLRQIWFQQSFSSGWSGALKLPLGEGGISASTELAEQQLSFPDIVNLLREFLEQISSNRQVRIGIDELDKMEDEEAHRFLNEIKVIFRVSGCFYFVSVSEDAMSAFERRGLPFRDVFDSSFDDVMQLDSLQFADSRQLLARRIIDLPLPFACLLHCISGGLPRDLIRAARDLVELPSGTPLRVASAELVAEALVAKAAAMRVAVRRLECEAALSLLSAWLEQLKTAGADSVALFELCESAALGLLAPLSELSGQQVSADGARELRSSAMQILAYAYFAASLIEFFGALREPAQIEAAISPPTSGESAAVNELAATCRSFSADLAATWESISDFRGRQGLATLPFPGPPPAYGAEVQISSDEDLDYA